jgi:hypothetical protein
MHACMSELLNACCLPPPQAPASSSAEAPANVADARKWIAGYKARSGAAAPASSASSSADAPANVADARQWIAAYKARSGAGQGEPAAAAAAAAAEEPEQQAEEEGEEQQEDAGDVYMAEPGESPFKNLFGMFRKKE